MSKLRIMRKTIRQPVWTILGDKELEKLPSITHKHWVGVSCLALGALRKEPLGRSQLNPKNHWFLGGSLEEKAVLVRGWKTVPHEGGWRNREEITEGLSGGKRTCSGTPCRNWGTQGINRTPALLKERLVDLSENGKTVLRDSLFPHWWDNGREDGWTLDDETDPWIERPVIPQSFLPCWDVIILPTCWILVSPTLLDFNPTNPYLMLTQTGAAWRYHQPWKMSLLRDRNWN